MMNQNSNNQGEKMSVNITIRNATVKKFESNPNGGVRFYVEWLVKDAVERALVYWEKPNTEFMAGLTPGQSRIDIMGTLHPDKTNKGNPRTTAKVNADPDDKIPFISMLELKASYITHSRFSLGASFAGGLSRSATFKYTASGKALLSFTLAVNDKSLKDTDPETGQPLKVTFWMKCNIWGDMDNEIEVQYMRDLEAALQKEEGEHVFVRVIDAQPSGNGTEVYKTTERENKPSEIRASYSWTCKTINVFLPQYIGSAGTGQATSGDTNFDNFGGPTAPSDVIEDIPF
jgi:hypothetical protein